MKVIEPCGKAPRQLRPAASPFPKYGVLKYSSYYLIHQIDIETIHEPVITFRGVLEVPFPLSILIDRQHGVREVGYVLISHDLYKLC